MTGHIHQYIDEFLMGKSDIGMLLIHLMRIEGDVSISRLNELLDQGYERLDQ